MENPIKVILSKSGNIHFNQQIYQDESTPIWIYTENPNLTSNQTHIEIIYLKSCDLTTILHNLYKRGVELASRGRSNHYFRISPI